MLELLSGAKKKSQNTGPITGVFEPVGTISGIQLLAGMTSVQFGQYLYYGGGARSLPNNIANTNVYRLDLDALISKQVGANPRSADARCLGLNDAGTELYLYGQATAGSGTNGFVAINTDTGATLGFTTNVDDVIQYPGHATFDRKSYLAGGIYMGTRVSSIRRFTIPEDAYSSATVATISGQTVNADTYVCTKAAGKLYLVGANYRSCYAFDPVTEKLTSLVSPALSPQSDGVWDGGDYIWYVVTPSASQLIRYSISKNTWSIVTGSGGPSYNGTNLRLAYWKGFIYMIKMDATDTKLYRVS